MSTSLTTTMMVARLQRKFGQGLSATDAMDYLNEGFRKITQMSKGGFIWQLKQGTVALPAGPQVANALPGDFDPGKSAIVYGDGTVTPTKTMIPWKPYQEAVNQQHFQAPQIGAFSCWTFKPNFTLAPPTNYGWTAVFFPDTAFPLALGGVTLPIVYHAVDFGPFPIGTNVFFPTPNQFDSLIIDLAEAELTRVYGRAGWEKLAGQATAAVQEIIDTYRTDRYDLAGLADQVMQANEKQAERAR